MMGAYIKRKRPESLVFHDAILKANALVRRFNEAYEEAFVRIGQSLLISGIDFEKAKPASSTDD